MNLFKCWFKSIRDVAQPGSAPHWGCGGRRFKSGHPDQSLCFVYYLVSIPVNFCNHAI